MAVFTKANAHVHRPRCEAKTVTHQRCQRRGTQYRDGMAVCAIHATLAAVKNFKERK